FYGRHHQFALVAVSILLEMVHSEPTATKNEETLLTALIIADCFDRRFAPLLTESSSWSCLKLANIRILDYVLEWLSRTEIRNIIIVVSSSHESTFGDFQEYWKDRFTTLKLISCQNCMSVGDAIREVDARSLITSDFLLITNPATICASDLRPQIKAYRERRKDKNNVMTLIYTKNASINPIIAVEKRTNRLVLYHRSDDSSTLDIDKSLFIGETLIRRDVRDTGIALCSVNISAQFSDNFDFQHRDDVIREIIVNEEILSQYIHVDVLPDNVVAFNATDYEGLLRANRLILQRWATPLVPGRVGSEQFISARNNLFFAVSSDESITDDPSRLSGNYFNMGPNVVFGMNCTIGRGTVIKNSSIGSRTIIGDGSTIIDCIIGEGVRIGMNVSLSGSLIADEVIIADNVTVGPCCILASKVSIAASKIVPRESVVCCVPCAEDEEDIVCSNSELGCEWRFKGGESFWKASSKRRKRSDSSTTGRGVDSTFEKSDDEEDTIAKEMDNTEKFFEEVKESMERIAASESSGEHLVRNLILEINSSKLAYNISMEDVAKNVLLAFLSLRSNSSFGAIHLLVQKWKALFANYYKPMKNQIQALIAVEEFLNANTAFKSITAKVVHMLYEEDIVDEDAILEWHRSVADDAQIRAIVAPIIDWLQEEDDEEVESIE
uniref:Translation initiation factor eIF2B subunit epsilon n=1 Tax=Parascaris univalens TaxID=6257 RepID=A0A915BVK3_PARUN